MVVLPYYVRQSNEKRDHGGDPEPFLWPTTTDPNLPAVPVRVRRGRTLSSACFRAQARATRCTTAKALAVGGSLRAARNKCSPSKNSGSIGFMARRVAPRITGADKTDTHPSNTAQRFPHSSRVNNPVRRTFTPKASAGTTRIAWRESPNTLRLV